MDYQFLGKTDSFWIGIYTLTAIAGTMLLAITGWFIYWQLRLATKSLKFDGILRMQEIVDNFSIDRQIIYNTFPKELIVFTSQFSTLPPGRSVLDKKSLIGNGYNDLSKKQKSSLSKLTTEQLQLAYKVIGILNDLGQLVEDGFVDRRIFLGKYHTMIIRLCHFLEAIRRQVEKTNGGNYGHRLLRMRHEAIRFNKICPKHRSMAINIVTPKGVINIIPSQIGSLWQRVYWNILRHLYY